MSEYQYYGWQTIDRPLTMRELDAVARLSSHMDEVSTTRAVVTYHWGDFKHNPIQVLHKYFDIFLYDSNFSCRRLAFRIPKKLLDPSAIEDYLDGEFITLETSDNYHLLEFNFFDETGSSRFEYVDPDQMLNRLETLREQIIQGDFSALYIVWLLSITQMKDDPEIDEILEPPVPSGLNKMSIGLLTLIEFFEIDLHLVSAAAASAHLAESSLQPDPAAAIPSLTREQMEGHLTAIVNGEAGAVAMLKKQLSQLAGADSPTTTNTLRTAGELLQMRELVREQEEVRAREEAERKHIQKLEDLSAHQEKAWEQVAALCQEKRARAYDEATQLLCDLHELSEYKNQPDQYRTRFASILDDYGKSAAFKDRLRRAGLL
jgi:hypothetical protein